MPTVKRSFTNQKTFCNRIVNRCNSLDSFLQIINLIMVFVNSQNVKLKRMKYHDPILWGNVLKGLYSLLMMSPVFYIQYQFTLLNCTRVVPEKKQNPKRKKARKEFVDSNVPLALCPVTEQFHIIFTKGYAENDDYGFE